MPENFLEELELDCCNKRVILSDNNEEEEIAYPFLGNELSDQEKIKEIEYHFRQILITLGMDLNDDSLQKTPYRFAKMFTRELFQGLDENAFPTMTTQENKFNYNHPLIESHICIQSICEHHFMPILGYCHIAYIPNKRIIGLSKLNRLAQYFARRPQVQERMTKQISKTLSRILETPNVAVVVDALHLCVRMRGVRDQDALTRTMDLSGEFLKDPVRREFMESIPKLSEMKI